MFFKPSHWEKGVKRKWGTHLIWWKIAFLGIEIAELEKEHRGGIFLLEEEEEDDECNIDDEGVKIAIAIEVAVIWKSRKL